MVARRPLVGLRLCNRFGGMADDFRLALRAKSAHEIDDNDDQQNQADTAAADERTSKVKSATTHQQKKNQQND
jgi:hypothetical protein